MSFPIVLSWNSTRWIAILFSLLLFLSAGSSMADDPADTYPGPSHYIRSAYQAGVVLGTDAFLQGENQAGQPIDSFHSVRLDFGWQTDGSQDWHHIFNFPSYGLGIYAADFFNDEELGTPTSLYGFYVWPLHRSSRWTLNFDVAFGLTNNWEPYDPVNNPQNLSMGLGRSVHIEGGPNLQYRLGKQWAMIGAVTFTHFSNGGTQRPNNGVNTVGPMIYVQYDIEPPVKTPARRSIGDYPRSWDLTVCGSAGKRNLTLELEDSEQREDYLNRNYMVGNLTVGLGYQFSHKSRVTMGLDLGFDESVSDLIELNAFNEGRNEQGKTSDNYELGLYGGYEIHANRTHFLFHLGYKVLYKDVPGRLPVFYQRLGIKHFVYEDWFVGMNVRFHDFGSADNLEWNLGYSVRL